MVKSACVPVAVITSNPLLHGNPYSMLPTLSVVSIIPIAVFPSGEFNLLRVATFELPPFLFTITRTNTSFPLITVVPEEIMFVNSFADDSNGFIG